MPLFFIFLFTNGRIYGQVVKLRIESHSSAFLLVVEVLDASASVALFDAQTSPTIETNFHNIKVSSLQ